MVLTWAARQGSAALISCQEDGVPEDGAGLESIGVLSLQCQGVRLLWASS